MKNINYKTACKLLLIYILAGITCGVIGTLFSKSISLVTNIRHQNHWLLYFLPPAGIVSVAIYKLLKVSGMGTNQVIKSTGKENALSPKLAPAVFLGSLLSHLCGASVGREGAALQLGGSSALFLSKGLKLTRGNEKVLIYCGMAGVFASVFGTPFAAAIFALEVVFVGHIYKKAIIPVFITSFTSFFTARLLGSHAERFNLSAVPHINFSIIWKVVILSLLSAVISMLFCLFLEYSEKLFKKLFKNDFLRIAIGGAIIVLLTVLVDSYDYSGAGIDVIEKIFNNNEFVPWGFALKILFTCIAVGSGFKGGEIVPTLFIGATFGALVGSVLGLPIAFTAAICMIALFCGVTNCPLASILLAAELFSGKGIGYICLAVILSFLLSGRISLYTAQKTDGFKDLF